MKSLVWIIVVIIIGAGAFYGGMQYEKSHRSSAYGGRGGFAYSGGTAGAGGSTTTMTPVRGQIIANNGSSITVKLADGSSKIVLISSGTSVMQSTSASTGDLTSGKNVFVLGTTNSDGSVTATNISLNPQGGLMRGGGGNAGSSNQGQ